MKQVRFWSTAVTVLAAGAGLMFATSNGHSKDLTAEDIQSTIVGRTLVAKRMGMTMSLSINTDGTVSARSPLMDGEGTWTIEGDRLCLDLNRSEQGRDRCHGFTLTGNDRIKSTSGQQFQLR